MGTARFAGKFFRALLRFARLGGERRRWFLRAGFALIVTQLRLGLYGLRAVPRWNRFAAPSARPPAQASIDHVIRAIDSASRWLPGTTCLVRGIAAALLLNRLGYPTTLMIGTAKTAENQLTAHAWVSVHGRIVIGATGAEAYQPIALWRAGHWRAASSTEPVIA